MENYEISQKHPIRKEVHTRSKFASKKYYEILRRFLSTQKGNGLDIADKDSFLFLSGKAIKKLHVDLERCLNIYKFYSKEYNNGLPN